MHKLIIYLDQNFISDIAKQSLEDKKDKVKPLLKDFFEVIKSGVDNEQFVSPDSWIHKIETAAENDPELQEAIHSYQGYLGQISFTLPQEIQKTQFEKAVLSYFNIQPVDKEDWKEAFRENPDKRMENYKIDILMDIGNSLAVSAATIQNLQKIRESGVSEKVQYKAEIEASRKHYKELIRRDFLPILEQYSISIEQAEEFIDSNEFTQIPNIDIFCHLWSRCLADKGRKTGVEGDYNDIQLLSTYLPYCDLLATDNYMKTMVKEFKIDQQYSCQVISMKEGELNEAIDFLEQEQIERPPANQSLFSVLCTKANEIQAYSVEFLRKLSLASNKFHRTGKYWNKEVYTEVFLEFSGKENIDRADPKTVLEAGPAVISPSQWTELQIFNSGFKSIENTTDKTPSELIETIPTHLLGPATAILPEGSVFDEDLREHDSDLFYDIEDAVENKRSKTKKYSIDIIHND
ncbi:MAG: hypothetical protein K8Q97_03875 [Candidatus Andersenbacteria bacterium]|nr:hypothetical protein [Candidatus Andersenbacteria bacterium]